MKIKTFNFDIFTFTWCIVVLFLLITSKIDFIIGMLLLTSKCSLNAKFSRGEK